MLVARAWRRRSVFGRRRHDGTGRQRPGRSRSIRPCSTPSITIQRSARRSSRSTRRPPVSRVAKSAYLPTTRFAVAIESRDRQQHLRPGPSAVRDSRDVGSGSPIGVRPAACGGARPVRCSPGSRSTSVFVQATVASAEAARHARARGRGADASRRPDRGRRGVSEHRRRTARRRRRSRPMWIGATCSRAPCTRSSTISCGRERKRRGATRNARRRRRA